MARRRGPDAGGVLNRRRRARRTALLPALLLPAALGTGCADRELPDPEMGAPDRPALTVREGGAEGSQAGGDTASAPTSVAAETDPAVPGAPDPAPRIPPPGAAVRIPDDPPDFDRPERVRGVYLNAGTAGDPERLEALIGLARRTEVNAFVIDVKDVSGFLSYTSGVPLAREIGAASRPRISDPAALLERLHEEGIYPIARIVIVRDPILAAARPELAVQDTAGGTWVDSHDLVWLNAFDERVWDYHLEIAREAAALGFPEIQWDYVRFPDAPRRDLRRARFPNRSGRTKSEAIRGFLGRSRAELDSLGVWTTADVFGATTSGGDIGIGQVWEDFIDRVHVALPMVYPSHYWPGAFGMETPWERPYEVVRNALAMAVRNSRGVEGAGRIRPWLQDFSWRFPEDRVPDVRSQIQAAYDAGVEEWVLWNPASYYTWRALAPPGGWRRGAGPPIRVNGRLVPVEERFAALEAPPPGEEGEHGKGEGEVDDTDEGDDPDPRPYRVLDPDSVRRALDSIFGDTVRVGKDTVDAGGR